MKLKETFNLQTLYYIVSIVVLCLSNGTALQQEKYKAQVISFTLSELIFPFTN